MLDVTHNGRRLVAWTMMKYFEFETDLMRRVAATADGAERLTAWTTVRRGEFGLSADGAGLHLLRPGDKLIPPAAGNCLVIGIATWSDSDMLILDSVVDRVRALGISAWVFDIDECTTFSGVQEFLPQVDVFVTQTPVLAYYVDGRIQRFGQGCDAARWLETRRY